MRPVKLTMQAFGPYPGRLSIDFRDAVEAGLFGIYGQTGSGKSTIFSAMTFALFGESAKTEQDSPSLRSDLAAPDTLTEVEFVFDLGERRFVILRRPEQTRPKLRGSGDTSVSHEASLFDATGIDVDNIKDNQRGKLIAEKKVNQVNAEVSDILGYGPEQFRQIILLPQGRFEKFLSAKTKERFEILRDLFDVSPYQKLMAKLKSDADSAERHVREEREVCVRRLAAENFESMDALIAGIDEVATSHTEYSKIEKQCRSNEKSAQAKLDEAKEVEALFKANSEAQKALSELQTAIPAMDKLASQIHRAENVRSLLDPESHVLSAASEIKESEIEIKTAQKRFNTATDRAKEAAEALDKETARSGEIDALRRDIDELKRHLDTIKKSANLLESVKKSETDETAAKAYFDNTQEQLSNIVSDRNIKIDELKAARKTEEIRQKLTAQLTTFQQQLASAEAYNKAQQEVEASARLETELKSAYEAAKSRASDDLTQLKKAKDNLERVQALHLASTLTTGKPCPVCGGTDHPAPATGAIENEGLNDAFRNAESVWNKSDKEMREIERKLTTEQGALKAKKDRLDGLSPPEEEVASLKKGIESQETAIQDLGAQIDISIKESEIESSEKKIKTLEDLRDKQREQLIDLQKQATSERARLNEMLSAVPDKLRDDKILAGTIENKEDELRKRESIRDNATNVARKTREESLVAEKDLQASQNTLTKCRDRFAAANETFQSRLGEAGLTKEEFTELKEAILTIEKDKKQLEEHKHKLAAASGVAEQSAKAIKGLDQPELPTLENALNETSAKLAEAINTRSAAEHQLNHLTDLCDELSDTQRQLDEAEAASGPLRNLAALFDGKNQYNLDLQTFAIGAMFDQVLESANLRLWPMSNNRYRLERDIEGSGRGRRGLGIQVFDVHTGKTRSTTTLSGGETFIAALSLALGLADTVENTSGKVRLDTIFIDEGFGSLDTENGSGTLDQVLQVLSTLVSQNRAVGLISHVPLVQEAIPNGFYVRKEPTGSSINAKGLL